MGLQQTFERNFRKRHFGGCPKFALLDQIKRKCAQYIQIQLHRFVYDPTKILIIMNTKQLAHRFCRPFHASTAKRLPARLGEGWKCNNAIHLSFFSACPFQCKLHQFRPYLPMRVCLGAGQCRMLQRLCAFPICPGLSPCGKLSPLFFAETCPEHIFQ